MPAINPHYLSEETDRRAIIGGLQLARRIFAAPAVQQFVRDESLPGGQVKTDDELLDSARRNGSTCYHASCACMMSSTLWRSSTTKCGCAGSTDCGSSTPR
jgi:choline dehydrogenase